MNRLTDWIKQHQVTAFFIIAFAITWGLGFSYGAVYKGQFLLAPLAFVGICGLALAGIIISTVCNTQPRLHSRTSPLIAALILALFWAPWHFFLRQAEGKPVITWQYLLEQYALLLPATFIIGWLYNRNKGSILVAGIAPAAANTAFAFLPNVVFQVLIGLNGVAVLLMILTDRMWKKLPPDYPAVYQASASDG